jgi:hypothetical protein
MEIYKENQNHLIIRWKEKAVRTIKLITERSVDITMLSPTKVPVIIFNVHGIVHCNNIIVYIPTRCTCHRVYFCLRTTLLVSGFTITHFQEHKITVTAVSGNSYTVLLSAAIVEELELV